MGLPARVSNLVVTASLGCTLFCGAGPASAEQIVAPRTHVARIDGQAIRYTAQLEAFPADEDHAAGATVTLLSYLRIASDIHSVRPVIFAFNGGPGASSIFLNSALLGPRRLDADLDPRAASPRPARIVDNDDSILAQADIVMIDPPATGLSRPPTADQDKIFSVDGDARAIASAIHHWLDAHDRTTSPLFILGESYGAVRSVEVARALFEDGNKQVEIAGLVLLSQSLPILDTVQRRSNIVGQAVGLPTLAATSWYHHRAGQGRGLEEFVRAAGSFAQTEYLPALFAGTNLTDEARSKIAEGLSQYTGITAAYFGAHDLYLSKDEYRHLLFSADHKVLGLYDTRFVGSDTAASDPSAKLQTEIEAMAPAFLRGQLGDIDLSRYRTVIEPTWNYLHQPFAPTSGATYDQSDYAGHLIELMKRSVQLRVLTAGGYYDTAASVGADMFLLSRPGLDRSRVKSVHYVGGHMFYTEPASRSAFVWELRQFLTPVPPCEARQDTDRWSRSNGEGS